MKMMLKRVSFPTFPDIDYGLRPPGRVISLTPIVQSTLLHYTALVIRSNWVEYTPELNLEMKQTADTLRANGLSHEELSHLEASLRQGIQLEAAQFEQTLREYSTRVNERVAEADVYGTLAKEACPGGATLPKSVPTHLSVGDTSIDLALLHQYGAYIKATQLIMPASSSPIAFLAVNTLAQGILAYGVEKYGQAHKLSPLQTRMLHETLVPFASFSSQAITLGLEWASRQWFWHISVPPIRTNTDTIPALVREHLRDQIALDLGPETMLVGDTCPTVAVPVKNPLQVDSYGFNACYKELPNGGEVRDTGFVSRHRFLYGEKNMRSTFTVHGTIPQDVQLDIECSNPMSEAGRNWRSTSYCGGVLGTEREPGSTATVLYKVGNEADTHVNHFKTTLSPGEHNLEIRLLSTADPSVYGKDSGFPYAGRCEFKATQTQFQSVPLISRADDLVSIALEGVKPPIELPVANWGDTVSEAALVDWKQTTAMYAFTGMGAYLATWLIPGVGPILSTVGIVTSVTSLLGGDSIREDQSAILGKLSVDSLRRQSPLKDTELIEKKEGLSKLLHDEIHRRIGFMDKPLTLQDFKKVKTSIQKATPELFSDPHIQYLLSTLELRIKLNYVSPNEMKFFVLLQIAKNPGFESSPYGRYFISRLPIILEGPEGQPLRDAFVTLFPLDQDGNRVSVFSSGMQILSCEAAEKLKMNTTVGRNRIVAFRDDLRVFFPIDVVPRNFDQSISFETDQFPLKGDFIQMLRDPEKGIESVTTKEDIQLSQVISRPGEYGVMVNRGSDSPCFLIDTLGCMRDMHRGGIRHPFANTPHLHNSYFTFQWEPVSRTLRLVPMFPAAAPAA